LFTYKSVPVIFEPPCIYQACDTNGNILQSENNTCNNTVHNRHNDEHAHLWGIVKSSVCWLEWQAKWTSLQNSCRLSAKLEQWQKWPFRCPCYTASCMCDDSPSSLLPYRVELRTAGFESNCVHTTNRCISSYIQPWQWRNKKSLKHWIPTTFMHIQSHRKHSVALIDTKISPKEWNNTKWLPQ